jgi:hypothetical protein
VISLNVNLPPDGERQAAPAKRSPLLPDPALALVACAACLGGSAGLVAADALAGVPAPGSWPLAIIVLGYVLFECIRHGRPLDGALAALWATLALVIPMVVKSLFSSRGLEWGGMAAEGLLVSAVAAAAGLVLGTAAWLVRRLLKVKPRQPAVDTKPPRSRWTVTIAAFAVALILVESVLWGLQRPFALYFLQFAVDWRGWQFFYQYDRLLLVVLAGVLAYAVLRRHRLARPAAAGYLAAGVVLAAVRTVFFLQTARLWPEPSLGHITSPGNGYQYVNMYPVVPSVSFDSLVRVNTVELVVRAVVCAVGLFLLLRRAGQRGPVVGPIQRG